MPFVTTPTLHLLCDANPMCYGSSTALLAVLDHVQGSRTAVVHDVTAEVLAADPAVDAVIRANVKDPDEVRRAIDGRHFDAALVVSNRSCLNLYLELGLPVFFVDILLWFGVVVPHNIWTDAERAFVQSFPGVDARTASMHTPPMTVGPLIRGVPLRSRERSGTLVQIGGAASRWVRPGENSNYPRMVADWMDGWTEALRPITFAAGRQAIRSIPDDHVIRASCELVTLPHREVLNRLGEVARYVTTPGLNSVFEGLCADVPMLFLPPQNATQVAQLRAYEAAGLVAPGLNLSDLDPAFPGDVSGIPERELTELVLTALPTLARRDVARRILDHLGQQLCELDTRAEARSAFREFLGPPGGQTIAEAISAWWGEQWM